MLGQDELDRVGTLTVLVLDTDDESRGDPLSDTDTLRETVPVALVSSDRVKEVVRLGLLLTLGLIVGLVVERTERVTEMDAVTDTLGLLEEVTDGLGELLRDGMREADVEMEVVPERHWVVVRLGGLFVTEGEVEVDGQAVVDLLSLLVRVCEGETLWEDEVEAQVVGETDNESLALTLLVRTPVGLGEEEPETLGEGVELGVISEVRVGIKLVSVPVTLIEGLFESDGDTEEDRHSVGLEEGVTLLV